MAADEKRTTLAEDLAEPAPPPDPLRPAWLTTEFYLAVAGLVAGLVVTGYALSGRADGEHTAQLVKDAIIGIGGLVLAVAPVYIQIKGRNELKQVAAAARSPVGD